MQISTKAATCWGNHIEGRTTRPRCRDNDCLPSPVTRIVRQDTVGSYLGAPSASGFWRYVARKTACVDRSVLSRTLGSLCQDSRIAIGQHSCRNRRLNNPSNADTVATTFQSSCQSLLLSSSGGLWTVRKRVQVEPSLLGIVVEYGRLCCLLLFPLLKLRHQMLLELFKLVPEPLATLPALKVVLQPLVLISDFSPFVVLSQWEVLQRNEEFCVE